MSSSREQDKIDFDKNVKDLTIINLLCGVISTCGICSMCIYYNIKKLVFIIKSDTSKRHVNSIIFYTQISLMAADIHNKLYPSMTQYIHIG